MTREEQLQDFAEFVADNIFDDDFNFDFFFEIACRKLNKLGIIETDGPYWIHRFTNLDEECGKIKRQKGVNKIMEKTLLKELSHEITMLCIETAKKIDDMGREHNVNQDLLAKAYMFVMNEILERLEEEGVPDEG